MPKVSKIMSPKVLVLKKGATISDAAKLMANKPRGCVVVLDNDQIAGIVTESDIVKSLVSKKKSPKTKVSQVMSYPVTTIDVNTRLDKASKIIDSKDFRRYPVVKEGKVVGIVTENEVVHTMNDNIKFHRNLQNTVLILFVLFEFFVFVLYRYLVDYFPFLR
jgi:CBS domain-containing protein